MPPQETNNMTKQQKINAGIEKLKAKRAEAAEKKARDAANPPGKFSASSTATSLSQAPEMSTSHISSLPRMKKRPGKSMSEVAKKKAAEEVAAAAKIQRKVAEKEDGEIDSDTEEIVYHGSMSHGNHNRKTAPVKGQKIFGRNDNTNEAKNTTKFKPDIKKLPPRVQKSQDLKKPEEKEQSPVKRKYFDTDSSDSEEQIAKPAKKAKTTKAGMDFENLPTKRKHSEEGQTSGPVKKQKVTGPTKKPVAAPAKRAPVKETKVRNNPTKNLLGFGGSKSTKKPAALKKPVAPKKGSTQPRSVSEARNENGEKSVENVLKTASAQIKPESVSSQSDSTTPSTIEQSKHRYLPDVSMEDLFSKAPNVAAQPIESTQAASENTPPRSAFDKVPTKTKSSRRGLTPAQKVKAPKVEVKKESASSTSISTMVTTRVAQPSRRKVTPAPDVDVAQPSTSIRSPSSNLSSTSNKAQPRRRGATPASKDEVIKPLPSSIPLPSSSSVGEVQPNLRRAVPTPHVESKKTSASSKPLTTKTPTKEAGRSASSGIIPSATAPRKVIKKGDKTDGVEPAPKSSVVDKMESTKGNMEEKPEPKKVEVTEQPKPVAEVNSSLPAQSNLEAEALTDTHINEDIVSLGPKVGPSSQAQRGMPQFLGFPGLQAGNPGKESVINDFFKSENDKEIFMNVTPNTELSDVTEARDTMEIEFERELQLEMQNSFHAEQLRSALEEAIVLRAEKGESDQDSSDEDSDEYSSGDESDEKQSKVTQRPSKPTVLYKGYNCVLQEEPFYARDRGYESGMLDADEDEDEDEQPSTLWHIDHGNKFARPVITKSYFKASAYRISAFDQVLAPAMAQYLEGKKARDAAAKEKASPPVPDPIFDDMYAYIDRCLGPRKVRKAEPVMPSSSFDELEAEFDRCLEAQQDEDAAAQKEASSRVIPRSAFDEIEEEENFSSDERNQHDYSEDIASAPIESSMAPLKSSTDFEGDFHGASFNFNDASGQESGVTEDPFSLLDTSFTFPNELEIPVEQSTSEDNDSDSTKESSNSTGDETSQPESPEANNGPYVSLDGCIGLPPLEDSPYMSEDSDDYDDSDNEDSEMSENEGSEMSENDESEIIILDDTTPTESEEDEGLQSTDDDEDAELYRKHRVPEDLSNVEITMEPTELQLLKAKTSWELFELQEWEQENDVEVHATFDRELLLRNMNVSRKRIANYMKVLRKYENRTVPKAEVVPEDISDDSDDEEFSHPTKLSIPQVVEVIAVPNNFSDIDIDADVESNAHPFGPIDW
ncbi:hypothetical protein BOTCAL_0089g00030 [Botryotinia calthae]|uniref:Uncharacterized protein n=1 Tax=Botryotinia calthae TaxID=38488 RepID=A0A4Y8D9N1_9HELO|nr:hypothetical protein BOTCAL_0089g00030 [Botryotinia calthae]